MELFLPRSAISRKFQSQREAQFVPFTHCHFSDVFGGDKLSTEGSLRKVLVALPDYVTRTKDLKTTAKGTTVKGLDEGLVLTAYQ